MQRSRLNLNLLIFQFQKRTDDSNEDSYEEIDEIDSIDPTTTDKPEKA